MIGFGSSDRLAAAIGLAVSCTMLATSCAYYAVIRRVWQWPRARAVPLACVFVIIDCAFIAAGIGKIFNGGGFPFLVAAALTLIATTWLEGRRCVARALAEQETPVAQSLQHLSQHATNDVPTMVLLSGHPEHVPFFARHRRVRDRRGRSASCSSR